MLPKSGTGFTSQAPSEYGSIEQHLLKQFTFSMGVCKTMQVWLVGRDQMTNHNVHQHTQVIARELWSLGPGRTCPCIACTFKAKFNHHFMMHGFEELLHLNWQIRPTICTLLNMVLGPTQYTYGYILGRVWQQLGQSPDNHSAQCMSCVYITDYGSHVDMLSRLWSFMCTDYMKEWKPVYCLQCRVLWSNNVIIFTCIAKHIERT